MQSRTFTIQGAGGKGGGGGGQELPDSIRSTQLADVLDLLSEGEVEGLTFGLKSVYLDGVPLQNSDDSFNFEGVQVQTTPGTQGQAAIAGADGVANTVAVGLAVKQATPLVRTISNPAVDTARVTIEVQQLTRQDGGSGDLMGSSFTWAVDVQSNGGGFVAVLTDTIDGKTTSRYSRSKEFALSGAAPWDIRVRRVSPDSASLQEVNEFRWSSYTEVQSVRLRYPNSAMVRLRVGAQQFSRIPTRAFDLMGMRVRVPTNYNTRTKVYTGVWDGTFKIDWTDCPAWIYYDIVTHNRYGLGRYFQVTPALKWQMHRIGRYCDEGVPDGRGNLEPRFKCGVYLATREQAYKVLTDLAAVFRGMAYWAGTDLGVVQDAPQDPVALFTNANVLEGRFAYAGASQSKRHSQVVVWFNSLQEFGKLVPEVVVDRALQARYGVRSLELSPLGIWSRGQAQRLGKWVLYSEQREGEVVTFRVGLDGALVAPGQVFQIADAHEAGERMGGRVRSATAAAVTLDKPVALAAGEAYELSVMLVDADNPARLKPQTRAVSSAAGQQAVLAVSPPFTSAPGAETVWLLKGTSVEPTTWRCLGLAPVDNSNDFEITAVRHEPQKYALIEQGIAFEQRSISRLTAVATAPASLSFTETVYVLGFERRSKVTLSWPAERGLAYLLSWRLASGPWVDVPSTTENCVDIDALAPGLLEVSLKSRNALGSVSRPVTGSYEVVANTTPALQLGASQQGFAFDAAGAPKPAAQSVAFTAQPVGLAGVVAFTATLFNAAGTSLGAATLAGTGNIRTLGVAAFGAAAYAVVQATLGAYSAQVTVARLADGLAGNNGQNVARVLIYRRASSPPAVPSATVTFTFASGAVSGLDNGWTVTIPAGTEPLYATAATAANAGATDTIASGEWAAPQILAQDGAAGSNGANSASVFIYQRAATAAALPSVSATFNFTTGAITGLNNGWSAAIPAGSEPIYVSTATAFSSGGTDTISPGEWAAVRVLAQNGINGQDGQNGLNVARVVIYRRASSAPAVPSGTATFTFATGLITGLDNGWSASIPGGTDPLWATAATASATGATDTVASGEWAGPQILAQDGAGGAAGANVASVFIYRRASSTPAVPSAAVTYTFATGAVSGLNNGWSSTVPAGTEPIYVSTATAFSSGGSDTINSGEWAAPEVLAQNGTNGQNGLDGQNGLNGLNVARVVIYRRASSAPAVPSGTATFTFATGGISGLDNGWTATIPGGTEPLWATAATASATGATDTVASGEWAAPQILVQDGVGGAAGANVASVFIYRRTSSTPAVPSSTVTYTFASGAISGLNNGWSSTIPAGTEPIYVSTATAFSSAGSDTISSGEWAAPEVLAQNGVNGQDGQPGTSVFVGVIYRQQAGAPAAPTGGSFNFGTSVLTAPSGWTVARPAPGAEETWSAQQTFTTTTPGATVAGGAWGSVVSVAAGTSGPATLLGYLYGASSAQAPQGQPAVAGAYVDVRAAGGLFGNQNTGGALQIGSWFLPNNSGSPPGPLYQVQWIVDFASGALDVSPAAGSWGDIDSTRYAGVIASVGAGGGEVYADAAGSVNIRRKSDGVVVCTGSWNVNAYALVGIQP